MVDLPHLRRHYARLLAAGANARDPRIEDAFATVPREDFVGPGPWTIVMNGHRVATPTADPHYLYGNSLVALDDERNNGEPLLHAMWLAKVAPKPGETAIHVGAGAGYYTAILARLVEPGGRVVAYEIEAALAARARANLRGFPDVELIEGDAVRLRLPKADIVYVNAGVVAPPPKWLKALRSGGRLVFPWRPSGRIGLALLVTRLRKGFAVEPFMGSWFIPCVGAPEAAEGAKLPSRTAARRVRSLWLRRERAPDDTAVAAFDEVWFSSAPVPTA